MKDLDKFLDDSNIIKKDVNNIQPQLENQQEIDNIQKQSNKQEKPKRQKKEKPIIKSRRDLIIEMIEKTQYQMLAKEVDYEVYQLMQQQHSSNQQERNIYQQNSLNVRKDHKMLERKLEILQKFLEETNG